jgi:glutamate/tyrosine decarboxylase-like PLP-dependent enzyme
MLVDFRSQGLSKQDVFSTMDEYAITDMPMHDGRMMAYVYDAGPEVDEVAKKAYTRFLSANALDPTQTPSLTRFENEIVATSIAHMQGDEHCVGNFTSGGTESCMLAVKTARDYIRDKKELSGKPNLVVPVTAHAAFHKAAHYYDMELRLVEVDTDSFMAIPEKMAAAVDENTVLLVASAVSYAHGVTDPIEAIGKIALENDICLHVDGCIGAFVLGWMRRMGREVTPFDFSVPGVTSISMDWHKYGYCPKGASVILHKNRDIRRHQIFTCSQWTGYTVINTTIQSTKSGGPVAACWAVINFLGEEGYQRLIGRTMDATDKILEGLKGIPELKILGKPEMSLVAFTTDEFNVFHLVDEMKTRDWIIQPQLGFHGSKENVHLSITQAVLENVDDFIKCLKESVEVAKSLDNSAPPEAMLQMLSQVQPKMLRGPGFNALMAQFGMTEDGIPDRLAGLNQVLNVMPPELTKAALTEYFNELFTPAA